MARIRTVKPEFYRHEGLQDLEIANPGKYPMMVFAGLWGHCDSKGRFEWKPRILKLDILPFLPFDMAETLDILKSAGMLRRYTVDGKEYGFIDTFEKHQRLTGKEATEGEKFPAPIGEYSVNQRGNIGEIPESQEGKGREKEVHNASCDGGFAAFWNCYPKKIGKAEALKAWRKIKPDLLLQTQIMDAVMTQKHSEQWVKDGGQFIPHASTWLNQRRWEDEQAGSSAADDQPSIFSGAI